MNLTLINLLVIAPVVAATAVVSIALAVHARHRHAPSPVAAGSSTVRIADAAE